MDKYKLFSLLLILPQICSLTSCNKSNINSDYVAYFGGEVTNPSSPYVLFCKNNEVIDTIALKDDNTFFKKFDSLTPGLYSFKNEPEYQYVYFDKNDSIMVHINSKDFDESIIFCGRGDEKNNFLMDMYLRNDNDKNHIFNIFEYDVSKFEKNIDSTHKKDIQFYNTKKEQIKWNEEFDIVAKSALNFHYYSKKEIYPYVHKMRTGIDITDDLPKNFYAFRKDIDFNNPTLSEYAPFVTYLSYMLNNIGSIKYHNHLSEVDLALKTNINKLKIADTLIKNKKVKNIILNNIAFSYLMEDQNMVNNQTFLDTYRKFSTDKSKKNEINIIGNAIQLLKPGKSLPQINLVNLDGKSQNSKDIISNHKTVIFFWTSKANSHLVAVHKKINTFKLKYPQYNFVGININDDQKKWSENLIDFNFAGTKQFRTNNLEELKAKWAITKVHRTIILDANGLISNAFTNIFDVNFEKELK